MIDFRAIFDELGIPWRDRGKNTSRGRIVIACPWCGDDPSEHLSIDENVEAYYCFRGPHKGYNLIRLLVQCGVPYFDAPELLNRHNLDIPKTPPPPRQSPSKAARRWQTFQPAGEDPRYTDYLRSRGFPTPIAVCRQYDLRFSPEGKWAQRLLIPVRENGMVITWIGRAIGKLDPKYHAEPIEHPGYLYIPREPRDCLVIVEGSMDALKIAVATDGRPVSSLALLGSQLSPAKLDRIINTAQHCHRVLLAMDADVSAVSVYAIIDELSAVLECPVLRLPLPEFADDPGALSISEVNDWIS